MNARIYGTDYIVIVSPVNGTIQMSDVRHTYLHYIIEPLLYTRANAIDRTQPILEEIREAPLEFRFRSDTVALTVECLIKAIEARTMDTGIPVYKIPAGVDRSQLPRYEHERQVDLDKVEAARVATVHHDMTQGFVLTQYFYEQLLQFEKDPAWPKVPAKWKMGFGSAVAIDAEDRVWAAWESGAPNWGKDTGFWIKTNEPGVVLGGVRAPQVRCYQGGGWKEPAHPAPAEE